MSYPTSILITGASGQLGSEFKHLQGELDSWEFHFSDSHNLDITDADAIERALSERTYQYLINCAAYTAVDKAESDIDLAYAINAAGAENLAIACKKHAVKLIHISTDFVFDGKGHKPYQETDAVHPIGVYGGSKEQGERLLLEANEQAVVIRTSWLYSSFGANFVKTMRRLGADRPTLNVIYDQVGTPTYARDLAKAIVEAIRSGKLDPVAGIFHYSNEGVASWYDFARAIMEMSGLACNVQPINTFEYPTPAARPHYSVLDKRKFKETFGTNIPYWRDSLEACIQTIQNAEK